LKKAVLFIVLVLMLFPLPVKGQEGLTFEELVVDIWPEYDDPRVLIIYRGVLSSQVSLPALVTFQIPAEAGQPNAVAVRDPENKLMSVTYERVVKGEFAEISFIATFHEVQFEYYDPLNNKEGNLRTFTYTWPGNHTVNSVVFQVQEPRGAYDLDISPPFGESYQGSDGLKYFRMGETQLKETESQNIQIRYQKSSDSLSVGGQSIQPRRPIEPQLSFSFQGWNLLPWLLGSLGFLFILGAVGIYWWFGEKRNPPESLESEPNPQEPVFSELSSSCPQCGSKTSENDRYCRVCGHKL